MSTKQITLIAIASMFSIYYWLSSLTILIPPFLTLRSFENPPLFPIGWGKEKQSKSTRQLKIQYTRYSLNRFHTHLLTLSLSNSHTQRLAIVGEWKWSLFRPVVSKYK